MPGFNAGNVQHFVDQIQQVPTTFEDLPDALGLFFRQVLGGQQLREPQHRIERRP